MVATYSNDCLYTTLKNISASAVTCSMLYPHGRRLAVQEEVSFFGDLLSCVDRGERVTNQRNTAALLRAFDNAVLSIVKTPNPILYNDNDDVTKMVYLANATTLAVGNGCWNSSSVASPGSAV